MGHEDPTRRSVDERDHGLLVDLSAGPLQELAEVDPAAVDVTEGVAAAAAVDNGARPRQEGRESRRYARVARLDVLEEGGGILAVAAAAGVEREGMPGFRIGDRGAARGRAIPAQIEAMRRGAAAEGVAGPAQRHDVSVGQDGRRI